MEIVRTYDFNLQNIRWPYFGADPFLHGGVIYYAYDSVGTITGLKIYPDGTAEEHLWLHGTPRRPTAQSGFWRLFLYEGHVLLSCGRRGGPPLFLDLDGQMQERSLPAGAAAQQVCRPATDETADAPLTNGVMHYKNSRRYQYLAPDGRLLWEETHRAYRYTPFEERDGCVIFGTAGHGGGLYCYRLADGACLTALDTGGTARYLWQAGRIVCPGREGQLLWLDPFRGEICGEWKARGKFSAASGLAAFGDLICAVGFSGRYVSPSIYLIRREE